jgi:hypothetical protein
MNWLKGLSGWRKLGGLTGYKLILEVGNDDIETAAAAAADDDDDDHDMS